MMGLLSGSCRNIGSARADRSGHSQARPRERHLVGADRAHRGGGEGRARPADRGDLLAGDARGRRGAGARPRARDATSLRVREGTGGMQALGDDDKANIEQTIDDEVLKRQPIEFRSTAVQASADGNRLAVEGELTLAGTTRADRVRHRASRDGTLTGERRRQADGLGHQAVLDAVRDAEGRRRGRGRSSRRRRLISRV